MKLEVMSLRGLQTVSDPTELVSILQQRDAHGYNGVELSPLGQDFPQIIVVFKEDLGAIFYIADDNGTSYASYGALEGLDLDGSTQFWVASLRDWTGVMNYYWITAEDAVKAILEFVNTGNLPHCINWLDL